MILSKKKPDNIEVLETEYAKKQYAEYANQQKQIVYRRRRLAVVFSLAAILFISLGVSLFNDYLRLESLKDYKQETVATQKETAAQKAQLQQTVDLLKDEDYVAKVARSRYLYSKKDELVFPLPENEKEVTSEKSTSDASSKSDKTDDTGQ